MSLAKNIQAVLDAGLVKSASGWSVAAGFTNSHVRQLFLRVEKNPDASMNPRSVRKLAAAAGVDFQWLLSGDGPPVLVKGGRTLTAPESPSIFMVKAARAETDDVVVHLFSDAALAIRCADSFRAAGWKAGVSEEQITTAVPEVE